MTRFLRRIAPALLTLGLLTACGTSPDTHTSPAPERPAVAVDDTTKDDTATDDTALIIDLTWARTSETDKDNMCAGIALLGTEWAADQMRDGGDNYDGIDWDRAALLVQDKCEDL
jgi:hypothetical protein